ncbi:MAG: polyhydroxyalkanoate synthesis regulator DNA-binding domain-containing protein [Deltaproteobacteria bacterium]|nr:polyhydroxyalkanoate synthesis regulator DNA-binding domain-containing protein [Deltaproteobacteria bacterium]
MNPQDKNTVKVIKRYQNRKLYDTQDSCYVTLEDIRDMIKQGGEIQVIDNASKEDLTSVTFAQIIFEEEKKTRGILPLNTFKQIIATGGEALKELVQKSIVTAGREIQQVKTFVDKQIKPTVESVQSIPAVAQEIRQLRSKIETLESKLKQYEKRGKP